MTKMRMVKMMLPEVLGLSAHLLTSLDMFKTNITGEELIGSTVQLINLKHLKLNQCYELTDAGLCDLLMRQSGNSLMSLEMSLTNIKGMVIYFFYIQIYF